MAVFFNQALKKAPRSCDSVAVGKLDGPTWAWAKMGLKKRAAIGYLYIWTVWPQKPPSQLGRG